MEKDQPSYMLTCLLYSFFFFVRINLKYFSSLLILIVLTLFFIANLESNKTGKRLIQIFIKRTSDNEFKLYFNKDKYTAKYHENIREQI